MRGLLFERELALGAMMTSFAGWELPLQYVGALKEHEETLVHAGLFDLSHMGRILVEGKEALSLLDYLSVSNIKAKSNNSCCYTVFCNEDGGSIDDVVVYKESDTKLSIIANGANRNLVTEHLKAFTGDYQATITPSFQEEGILAVQGPDSEKIVKALFPLLPHLEKMHFCTLLFNNRPVIISRTGYTGTLGFEMMVSNTHLQAIFDACLQLGAFPCGLAARDLLRLEMGYSLFGHELSSHISPLESPSFWTVKWDKGPFLGQNKLIDLHESSLKRHSYGIVMQEGGIPRQGCKIFQDSILIGEVTSGSFSPVLQKGIGLILSQKELEIGDSIFISIRDKKMLACIVKLPFVTR